MRLSLSLSTCVYICRPLQSVERVRPHLLAYNIQSPSNSHPRSKAPQRTSVQPAHAARQLESRNPTLQAPMQLESRIWVPGCLDLIILSSYHLIFFYRGATRPQQPATGCHRLPNFLASEPSKSAACHRMPLAVQLSGPRTQYICLNRCYRLHRSAK